jgi:hypothetical protein
MLCVCVRGEIRESVPAEYDQAWAGRPYGSNPHIPYPSRYTNGLYEEIHIS